MRREDSKYFRELLQTAFDGSLLGFVSGSWRDGIAYVLVDDAVVACAFDALGGELVAWRIDASITDPSIRPVDWNSYEPLSLPIFGRKWQSSLTLASSDRERSLLLQELLLDVARQKVRMQSGDGGRVAEGRGDLGIGLGAGDVPARYDVLAARRRDYPEFKRYVGTRLTLCVVFCGTAVTLWIIKGGGWVYATLATVAAILAFALAIMLVAFRRRMRELSECQSEPRPDEKSSTSN